MKILAQPNVIYITRNLDYSIKMQKVIMRMRCLKSFLIGLIVGINTVIPNKNEEKCVIELLNSLKLIPLKLNHRHILFF